MTKSNNRLEDIMEHSGVRGMRWGHRKSDDSSRGSSGPKKTSKKVIVAKTLAKGVAAAIGLPHGNPNVKLTGKNEKRVGNIIHYTMLVTTGGSSTGPSHRRIGDKRIISKGEKVVERHLDRVVRVGNAAAGFL